MATLTKGHFEEVAEAIRESKRLSIDFATGSAPADPEFVRGWDACTEYLLAQLANTFERSNGRFDRDRFTRACQAVRP